MKVTLKDIALRAGYTVNTVSRALKDKDDIAPATRESIQAIAAELGYVRNSLAGSLRSGLTRTIALIGGDIANPYFGIVAKEVEQAASKHHYTMVYMSTEEDAELERQAIFTAIGKHVDGIIICPAQKGKDNIRLLQQHGVPFVMLGRRFADENELNYIVNDDRQGGLTATDYLLDKGHQHILFLNGPSYISSARERLGGYLLAYQRRDLPVNMNLIRETDMVSGGARQLVKGMLEAKKTFTAIIAFNDLLAWETIFMLQKMGYSVPGDFAVVGFDNVKEQMLTPFPLTSIGSSAGKLARRSLDILLHSIHNPGSSRIFCETAGVNLHIGQST